MHNQGLQHNHNIKYTGWWGINPRIKDKSQNEQLGKQPSHAKLEVTAWQTKQLGDNHNDTPIAELIRLIVSLGGKCTITLINSKSQGNLMGHEAARRLGVILQKK